MDKISELKAIPFRDLCDYCVLFFALAAAGALCWRRSFPPFETALLLFATIVSFRSARDVWVMVIVATTILAANFEGGRDNAFLLPRSASVLVNLAAGLAIGIGFRTMHVDNLRLHHDLAEKFPVAAVDFVREHNFAGPLYNDFDWGGYMIWSLRQPVAIDGRAALHGDDRINQSIATWSAGPGWSADPQLRNAGVVIGGAKTPLTEALGSDPGFQLKYKDQVAAVFVARGRQEIVKLSPTR